ncbi:hypothetical protein LJB63_16800, partial [[Eubacterium] rectale]|nr:hypothetical protein [Agathobacter rectalis]
MKTLISWLFGTGGVLFEITHSGILLVTRILESAVSLMIKNFRRGEAFFLNGNVRSLWTARK